MAAKTKYVIFKRFNLWNDLMLFLDKVDLEYKKNKVIYEIEIYYSEALNDYKVKIMI